MQLKMESIAMEKCNTHLKETADNETSWGWFGGKVHRSESFLSLRARCLTQSMNFSSLLLLLLGKHTEKISGVSGMKR